MNKFSLHETFSRSGEWFSPETPGSHISGSLTLSPERITLDLNAAFAPAVGDFSITDPPVIHSVIHGVTSDGDLISLMRPVRTGLRTNLGSGGFRQREKFACSTAIIGGHLSEAQKFRSARFEVPGLSAWLDRSPIAHELISEGGKGFSAEQFVRSRVEPEITRVDTARCEIRWGVGTNNRANVYRRVEISVYGWIEIIPDEPQCLEWFLDQHETISSMLTFFAGVDMPAEKISLRLEDARDEVHLFVAQGDVQYCALEHPLDFYFPRRVTSASLQDLVWKWFSEIESVETPSKLAVSTLNSKGLWLHVKFLSLAQILEGFHRGRFAGDYMSSEDYEEVKKVLSSAIPARLASDHKDSLRSRIRYGNQLSLSRRLNELADQFDGPLAKMIFGLNGKVPRTWVDTRNYFTHWDVELDKSALHDQGLYDASIRMEVFVRSLFLMLMGISSEELTRALAGRHRTSQRLAQINTIDAHRADPSRPKGVLYSVRTGKTSHNGDEARDGDNPAAEPR